MLTILNLFGRSPFTPLRRHMERVTECVYKLPDLFKGIKEGDFAYTEEIATLISKLEHNADLTKNEIRNHLPKTIYLPIDRGNLLEILSLQDSLADAAEDIAVVLTLKPIKMHDAFKDEFDELLNKNLKAFNGVREIMNELHELLESSFGGIEAEKVRKMIDKVALLEHEGDLIQRHLLKKIIQVEDDLSYSTFHIWMKVIELVASISNISEKLAFRVRTTLDIK